MSSLTLSNSSTKVAGNQISRHESYRIFLGCIRCCAIASHNLLSRYIKTNIKSTSAFCKGNICRTVDSFIILIKTDRVRRKTILVQGRLVFFSPKDNIKQKKSFATSPLWNLWLKISHPRLAACLTENENNSTRLFTENRHFRFHLTPVVRPKNTFVRWLFTSWLDLHIERGEGGGGFNQSLQYG